MMKPLSLLILVLSMLIQFGNIGVCIAWHEYVTDFRFVYFVYIVGGLSLLGYIVAIVINLQEPTNRRLDLILLVFLVALQCAIASVFVVMLESLEFYDQYHDIYPNVYK
jgi:hypothetical protein